MLHDRTAGTVAADVASDVARRSPLQFVGPSAATASSATAPTFQNSLTVSDAGGMRLLPAALDGSAAMSFVLHTAASSRVSTRPTSTDHLSDQAMRADVARAAYHVNGTGVKLGILSDSFNVLGGQARDVAYNNLPANVQILKEGPDGSHDEGRAMADLVHRIAPATKIAFYSATHSEAEFAAGIDALVSAGCDVIVDDVAYLDEPFYQTGSMLQNAVERAVGAGVSYFTSASNEGTNYYEHAFAGTRTLLRGLPGAWTVNNFGSPGASRPYVNINIPNNGTTYIDLQWDQAFASISGGAGAASSLAMALYTADGQLVGTAGSLAVGHDPRQLLQFTNHTGQTNFRLVILSNAQAAAPANFKFIVYGAGTVQDANAGHGSGTVTGHELVAGANTVGAVAALDTPRFGGTNTVESFSSVGSGTILFDAQGNRLATPLSSQKVSFLAPDGSATSVFAPFYGTSAAAPNAAAVAALMLQENPYLTPGQVSDYLSQSAIAANGPAGSTGAGLIQADLALQLAAAAPHHA